MFASADKVTFEDEFTDMGDFTPFMEAMIDWKICEIQENSNEE